MRPNHPQRPLSTLRPVKTSPNMAYYDPASVELALLIKSLQSQHRLPLGRIKAIVKPSQRGEEIAPLVTLAQEVFGRNHDEKMNTEQFLAATGMEAEHLEQLLKEELLLPLEPSFFDHEDLAMARIYMRSRSMGMKTGDGAYYVRLGKKIVDQDIRLRSRLTRDLPPELDAQVTLGLVQTARAVRSYVIDRLFQQRIASMGDLKEPHNLEPERDDEEAD